MKTKFKRKKNRTKFFIIAMLVLIIAVNILAVSLKITATDLSELNEKTPSTSPSQSLTLAWGDNGSGICTADNVLPGGWSFPYGQQVKVCSDGAGGVIIAWHDNRSGDEGSRFDIYAQRINSRGDALWSYNGVPVCSAIGNQILPKICSDGAGGAIIAWTDTRSNPGPIYYSSDCDVYVQRVSATGQMIWQENGIPISTLSDSQMIQGIISDSNNGAILMWMDGVGTARLYTQRIDSGGNLLWNPSGNIVSDIGVQQTYPSICSDGNGGAIIVWEDNFGATWISIYAQRLNSAGNRTWGDNGVLIHNGTYLVWNHPKVCTDGSRGAIITWGNDQRGGIFAQRVLSSGETFWDDNGTAICTLCTGTHPNIMEDSLEIISKENKWAIIAWADNRSGNLDVYAQQIDLSGNTQWNDNGKAICTEIGNQYMVEMCPDEAGGAIITWGDLRKDPSVFFEGDIDIFAQRISSNGANLWGTNGLEICTEKAIQKFPVICSDGNGGAFIAWDDYRDDPLLGADLYSSWGKVYAQYASYYPLPSEELIWLDPYKLNIINDTEIGVYFEIDVDSPSYFQTNRSELPFNEINSTWLNMSIYYFYNFDLLNLNLNEDSSLLSSALVRFYYNTSVVKDPSNLKVLLGVFHALHISIWVSQNLTLNENESYVEMTTNHFSYYCLGEIETPNPFLIWLQNWWWVIVILSAIAIAIPTAYVYSTKRSKERSVEMEPLKEIPEKSIKLKGDLFERAMQKRERLLEMEFVEAATPETGKKPKKAKKKVKDEKFTKTGESLDQIPSVEQKEVSVHEDTLRCQVHKGAIEGLNYTCPKCKANYCLECAKALVKRGELCWVCNSKINIQSGEEITEIPIQEQLEVDVISLSKEELFERGFVNAASILHVWILNSQNNSQIYTEVLDTKYLSDDTYKLLLPKILSETYEKDKFIEKAYHFEDKNLYCLMYFSKFLLNFVIVSRNRLDSTYYKAITDTVEKLEEEFVEIQESPHLVRNILDKKLELHLSREYSQIPSERDSIINKLFKDTEEINLVKSEMQRLPEKSFPEFLELYSELTTEMKEMSKENEDLRNSNKNIEGY